MHMRLLLLVSCLLLFASAEAQIGSASDSVPTLTKPPFFHRNHEYGSALLNSERSLGIMPEVSAFSQYPLGLALGLGQFMNGEGGGTSFGIYGGGNYSWTYETIAPKVGVWAHTYAFVAGVNAGADLHWYPTDTGRSLVIRPKVGIGLYKFFIYYGRNFGDLFEVEGVHRNSITITGYITTSPWKP